MASTNKQPTDRRVFLTRVEGSDNIRFSVDQTEIYLNGLALQPSSNWAYPHRIVGLSKASVLLTDGETTALLCEWMRLMLNSNVEVTCNNVDFKFSVVKTGVE